MNLHARVIACAFILLPAVANAQDEKKWKPYQFVGNERYEYKILSIDGEERKEMGYIFDIRKKDAENWDCTWSTKSVMKKSSQGAELLMGGLGLGLSPAMFLMNPLFGAFLEQVELKEGEKMSLFGAGVIKVTKKETVGGRSGFTCELYTKQDNKDELTWSCTVDPALALPIRSITFEGGKEKHRMELVSYHKD
jgi:hypothetical protein